MQKSGFHGYFFLDILFQVLAIRQIFHGLCEGILSLRPALYAYLHGFGMFWHNFINFKPVWPRTFQIGVPDIRKSVFQIPILSLSLWRYISEMPPWTYMNFWNNFIGHIFAFLKTVTRKTDLKNNKNVLQDRRNELKNASFLCQTDLFLTTLARKIAFGRDMLVPRKNGRYMQSF